MVDIEEKYLTVYLYHEDTNTWEVLPTIIEEYYNFATIITTHFSHYAIGIPNWQNVDEDVQVFKTGGAYDPKTGVKYASLKLKNITEENLDGSFRLVFSNITDGVKLANATGTTTEGNVYIDVDNIEILSGEFFDPIELGFRIPEKKIIENKNYTIYVPEFLDFDFEVEVLYKKIPQS
ncbi:hypothetical protein A2331_00085 [Candidatus Falkowbacteria bacterium RIFOXYB2_FULL_34_18]|uniref:Uncharacterized protein n=1 Tax=Candidatus Falkowbacteria bacterium RIFOXYD2_FULL_34_120 TaxID=1798007 RepID=A0A1F5TT60_9BACT|nr:MAG: hypothetical protein A2331_00085 [Candidatus Falkowbacteria bacterium RIFOXYB2_FULL_34_18]OGF29777.1 MAG: hypothetical protein A2500_01265 [Candidatus Falkowbacteria bacterium RIFOXYC12_FULL_34_55]OGF37494.1 MAG: hypothetical protein A2466_00645 [Candidatus Falkowbacteria bacterium RIFOXYC2_FULL_34_220]OGF39204.1 MAG: hypothetical protein A2515_01155 [Candidatus Falkowbacteria bacterium RIFOXYD12_FULL_34_57]OGF41771.1 MAG: hypothetical protein A2531_05815 [Candidatus Falkowbacteria bact